MMTTTYIQMDQNKHTINTDNEHSSLVEAPLSNNIKDPICVRFIRKKFECLMTLMVLCILFGQIYMTARREWSNGKVDLQWLAELLKIIKDFTYNDTLSRAPKINFPSFNSSVNID